MVERRADRTEVPTLRESIDPGDPRMSLAAWLRAGRAQRGLTLEDVARVTKIQARILERIEGGKPDGLPADVFVRGFVRSFAKCVGLDEDEALRRYGACAGTPSATARAMVDAMADLAPSAARAGRAPRVLRDPDAGDSMTLAAGSLRDLQAQGTAQIAVVTPAEAGAARLPRAVTEPGIASARAVTEPGIAPAAVARALTESEIPSAAGEAPRASRASTEAGIAPPAAASTASGAAAADTPRPIYADRPLDAAAQAAAFDAAAPTKKKRTRRGGKGRKRAGEGRAALATGTPAEASPIVAAPASLPEAAAVATAVELADAAGAALAPSELAEPAVPVERDAPVERHAPADPAEDADEPLVTAPWRPKMPPAATHSLPPWRRPRQATAVAPLPVVPSLVIDDADPEGAEQVLEEREAARTMMTSAQRRSFLPPILLDREDRSTRQGGLTLAVILLLIAATLTLSYLMRRPSSSGDGVTLTPPPPPSALA